MGKYRNNHLYYFCSQGNYFEGKPTEDKHKYWQSNIFLNIFSQCPPVSFLPLFTWFILDFWGGSGGGVHKRYKRRWRKYFCSCEVQSACILNIKHVCGKVFKMKYLKWTSDKILLFYKDHPWRSWTPYPPCVSPLCREAASLVSHPSAP